MSASITDKLAPLSNNFLLQDARTAAEKERLRKLAEDERVRTLHYSMMASSSSYCSLL